MIQIRRVILIIMDSVGIGELPDADEYGDKGAHTLTHAAESVGGVTLPNLESLGLGQIEWLRPNQIPPKPVVGSYGKMSEISKGKDTTTGHWEMMGIIVEKAFPTYPDGFPKSLIDEFEKAIGRKTIGNKVASGTEIIKELGNEHYQTGYLIVYTSADSVFQVAAHEKIIPLEQLYEFCKIARKILKGDHAVGRIIARPFEGEPGNFFRTHHRHDFSLEPLSETVLDRAKKNGLDCVSVGKIWDIFAGRGLTKQIPAGDNSDIMEKILEGMNDSSFKKGILFANLVDFDMLYNHRQDPKGLIKALLEFDNFLPKIFNALKEEDALIIAADHGNDPTDHSTDHCREYVPILICGKNLKQGVNLGVRKSFSDCGQTIAEFLNLPPMPVGKSFAKEILKS